MKKKKKLYKAASAKKQVGSTAFYLAHSRNALTCRARILLGEMPTLSPAEQAKQLYNFLLFDVSTGNSVAEQVYHASTGAEPYAPLGVPVYNPFPVAPEIEALFQPRP